MGKTQKAILILVVIAGGAFLLLWPKSVKEVLVAYRKDELWSSETKLSLFSDSTYIMNHKYTDEYNSLVTREYKGYYLLKNDTMHFTGGIDTLEAQKATVKNNMLEFTDGGVEGLPIIRTKLKLTPAIDPKKYPDFMIFTYKPGHHPFFGPEAKSYDLQEKDMPKLLDILKTCMKDECQVKGNNYVKKCYATISEKGERAVAITFHLKSEITELDSYCYPAVRIYLDKNDCEEITCFGG